MFVSYLRVLSYCEEGHYSYSLLFEVALSWRMNFVDLLRHNHYQHGYNSERKLNGSPSINAFCR